MTDGLKLICQEVRKRVRNNNDEVIAIEGYEGTGKTSLGITMGKEIYPDFDFRKNIAYLPSFNNIENKFNMVAKYGVILLDEVIKILYKMRALERLQKEIVEFYATERKQNKITEMCIPRFMDLNENFRNHRVRIRVWVPWRGQAVAYIKDPDKDVIDPWHVKHSLEVKKRLLGKQITDREKDEVIVNERRTLNYLTDFTFPDITKDLWDKYMEAYIEEKAQFEQEKRDNIELEGTRAEAIRNALINLLKDYREDKDNKVSIQELSEKTGLSTASISKLCRTKLNI